MYCIHSFHVANLIMLSSRLIAFCIYFISVFAASADDWRGRIIYQVLTDRFARSDGSTSYPCNTGDLRYCGGQIQINKIG